MQHFRYGPQTALFPTVAYPIVHQHDANDCGPACLAMVAAHYGTRQSIAQLREKAGTDRQGTNLAGLIQTAQEVGFQARGVRTAAEGLSEVTLPAIAHWSEDGRNHFVVIFKQTSRRVTIGDPALGVRKLTPEVFRSHWTGILILLKPTLDLRELSTPSVSKLWSLVGHHRKLFLDTLLAAVLMTILGLALSFFIQVLVDFVFLVGAEPALNWLGLGMLLVLCARVSFLGLRVYLLVHLSHRIDADIVLGYHHHLLGLPLNFFWNRRTGEILSRLSDAMKIRLAISGTGLSAIVDGATLFLTSVVMFILNWQLALVSLVVLPILVLAIWGLTRPMKRAQRAAMERAAHFESHAVEAVGAIDTIKTFRAEDRMRLRGEIRFYDTIDAGFRAAIFALHASTSTAFLTGLSTLGLLWIGGHEVLRGELTVGQLMALYTMLGTIVGPIERLATANHSIQDALIAGERLGEIFEIEGEGQTQQSMEVESPIEGSIEFHNVSFRYGNRLPIIQNQTLRIDKGECCRIMGSSGSGKTTLVRSLGRHLVPETGRVLIDGIDIQYFSLESLRRQVVYLSQDSYVLSISIADNIRLGKPDATTDDLRQAARRAGAEAFIDLLPLGYDSVVGERGATLSGGERQRLALARAILVDPPILVLDEPTNHLDARATDAVRNLIEQRQRENRTTIVISHDSLPSDRTVHIGQPAYGTAT